MKKLLLSLIALVCSMSMNAQIEGTATRTGNVSVKWVQLWENGPRFAEYNVGAANNKAEDYGGYYCWGSSIDRDSNEAYKSGNDALSGKDDTATNLWGENWRMPTKEEYDALLANCDVEWTTVSGVDGRKFTGKDAYSSNSVFFPAAGYSHYGNVGLQGIYGYYWSSTPYGNAGRNACYLVFSSDDQAASDYSRNFSHSVRAVLAVEPGTTTAIEGVADKTINTVRGGKKFFDGDKLIIMGNDGKMYNTLGVEIKK